MRTVAHYCARFTGRDEDVNLDADQPEFRAWKGVEPRQLPELIVPFKRDLYRRRLEEFSAALR